MAFVVQEATRFGAVDRDPDKVGTEDPTVMAMRLAVAVTDRAVIVHVPEVELKLPTLVWVAGAEREVELYPYVPTLGPIPVVPPNVMVWEEVTACPL